MTDLNLYPVTGIIKAIAKAEIDDRVAHLYGLTAEEMKIIRGE